MTEAVHPPNESAFPTLDLAINGQGLDDFELGPPVRDEPVAKSYKGRRKSDGATVLIRCLSKGFDQHPALLEEVRGDLRAWIVFQHPNLQEVLALGTSHGRGVVVYAYTSEPTLEAVLAERGRLSVKDASAVARDLAALLVGAGARGLHVGDIRSATVHLGARARLADAGLARASCVASGLGRFGLRFGHPAYLAPEALQVRQERPSAAGDVYALGILLYELICGRRPFEGTPQQLLEQHFDQPLPPPSAEIVISSAVGALITGMTAKRGVDRLSPKQALASLTQLVEGTDSLALPVARPKPELITPDGWDRVAGEQAQLSGRWSPSKIADLMAVGPEVDAQVSMRFSAGMVADIRAELVEAPKKKQDVDLREKIGRGVVGTVYAARVSGHDGDVVVKVLSRMYSKHAELYERILSDLQAATQLRHPRVVGMLELRRSASTLGERDLLIMECARGQTLRRFIELSGAVDPERAAELVSDVAEALEVGAALGLAHGDVCPEKIYVDDQGRAQLADFGQAEAACLGAGLGRYGVPFGRAAYLAPEVVQENKRRPEAATDVYALGVVLYELLTGKAPFSGDDPKQALLDHLQKPLPRPPAGIAVPRHLAEILARMTAKSPKKRSALADVRPALKAPVVEEFNPLSTRDSFTSGEWVNMQEMAAKSRDDSWTREALIAPADGPDAFRSSEEGLAAYLEQARGRVPQSPGAAEGLGQRAAVNLNGVLVAVGGLAATVIVVLGIITTQHQTKIVSARDLKTASPSPEEAAREQREARVAAAIAACDAEVAGLIGEGNYKQAHAIGERIDSELRSEEKVQRAVQRLERDAERASAARVTQARAAVSRLLDAGKLEEATREVDALAAVVIDARAAEAIRRLVVEQQDALSEPVRVLKSSKPMDARKLRQSLAGSLRGWKAGGRLFDGGGVVLRYADAAVLAKDLRRVRGATLEPGRAPISKRPPALRIKAPRGEPAVYVLAGLPLERILDARLEVVLSKPPSGSTQVAILAGADLGGTRGGGFTFGVVPVRIRNEHLASQASVAIPPIPELTPMALLLEQSGEGDRARLRGLLNLPTGEHRARSSLSVSSEGLVALYVEDAEVWVTSLEIRGLLDPAGLSD